MKDTRPPISRMIDAACGIPDGPPKTDNTKPRVTLECKKCKKTRKVAPDSTDPAGTARVLMLCPDCNSGDFDVLYYFDATGKEITAK